MFKVELSRARCQRQRATELQKIVQRKMFFISHFVVFVLFIVVVIVNVFFFSSDDRQLLYVDHKLYARLH